MSKRTRREHGRIISVETLTRGDALAADVTAGATSITVNDAGDFDEDGGWLYIGAQTVEYTACDDETGVITLADPLTAAGEQGDPVQVWSDLYDEVVDYQLALVELDGEYDNPDPVAAEVAEGVGDLPEGDRGKAGESCTLLRVADDEWEVVGVGGRARKSRGIRIEWDDTYTLIAADIAAGTATFPLTHQPVDEGLWAWWHPGGLGYAGVPQGPSEHAVNYDAPSITWPLTGCEQAGDALRAHYVFQKGMKKLLWVPIGHEWRYKSGLGSSATIAQPGYDDSTWAQAPTPFGFGTGVTEYPIVTQVPAPLDLWIRLDVTTHGGDLTFEAPEIDNGATVYLDGTLVQTFGYPGAGVPVSVTVPCPAGSHTVAIYGTGDGVGHDYLGFTIREGG